MPSMSGTDNRPPAIHERDLFGRALVAALVLEIIAILTFIHFANQAGPVANHRPRIMKIQMLAPPPKPKPLPTPPKPMPPPPKPLPPPPMPLAPPKPLPPPPKPIPKPRPIPHPMKPVPHVAVPKPQPSPPPPPPQPVISAAQQESATQRYAALVHQAVQNDLRVPRMVEMMHLRGITTVAIRLAPNGLLHGVSVMRSSGAPPIDRAALAAVRATRFPPFSSKMPHHALTFDLQVKLRGG